MFDLEICATSGVVATIKVELTRRMPDIKSSHRCEAIARALGFATYASALTATKNGSGVSVLVQGKSFVSYLAEHGYVVSPEIFYASAAKVALHAIVRATPRLTIWGIGIGGPQRHVGGRWETPNETYARFLEARRELVSDAAVQPFLASLALLARVKPTKTIRDSSGSYWLKHIAENYVCTYPEGQSLGPDYVPNGALIAAALQAGFQMKVHVDERGYEAVNVSFNMPKLALEDLDCEIRPKGSRAEDRRRKQQMRDHRRLLKSGLYL